MVMSGLVAGAEMSTRGAPAARWVSAFSRAVNKPVQQLRDLLSGEILKPGLPQAGTLGPGGVIRGPGAENRSVFTVMLKPHSYRVFRGQ
jgi:hypothetical protein